MIILNILFLIVSYKYSENMENQFAKTNVSFQYLFYEKKNWCAAGIMRKPLDS